LPGRRNYPVVNASRGGPARETANVVGCLCTPLDRLAEKLPLPETRVGDLIALFMAGAYGRTASPEAFLGHPPARELLV
jgi:diaminopimelate decarboxylase